MSCVERFVIFRLYNLSGRCFYYCAKKIYNNCPSKPNFDHKDHILLEEDKLKIVWGPADIERWLQVAVILGKLVHFGEVC